MSDRPGMDRPRPSARIEGLLPQVYDELRRVARHFLIRERDEPILQPTALVHEAYLRLARVTRIDWQGKTHFLAVAATEMRRILVEHARAAKAQKRGGNSQRITLHEGLLPMTDSAIELLMLDESLDGLQHRSPRQARVAELKVFSGMTTREIADALDVSERTVKGDWQMARTWLAREIRSGGRP